MGTSFKVFLGFLCGIAAAIGVPLIILALGLIDWSATAKPGPIEALCSDWAFTRSMQTRAPRDVNPFGIEPAAIAAGLAHYRENCLMCHGAPGVEKSEVAKGLNPPAPALEEADAQNLTDGQLFWIIKNGIRMTGMPAFGPTHKDQEIWQIISSLRHLSHLSAEEKKKLDAHPVQESHHEK